jgi:3-hydroxyacyl-[acyl-carrier-protein] dehydratase
MWYSYNSAELDRDNAVAAQVTTDAHSPWFAGHFPDDPILPGIAQLHMVTETIAKVLQKELSLQAVTRVKFKKIIRPGDVLNIHAMTGKKENHYSFKITSEQQEVCSGRLVLAPTKEQQRKP